MKAYIAAIFAVLIGGITTVSVSHHRAQPAPQPVGLAAVSHGEYALRAEVEASRSMARKPLHKKSVTRRVTSVDVARHATKVVVTSPSATQRYALSLVGPSQFACLKPMWDRESHWNPNDRNPSSGAYGIAQFLPSTWASVGYAPTSDPRRQVDAGLAYIHERYGSPCGAWAFWQRNYWY